MTHAAGEWVARLRLDPTAWIAPGAVVTGEVTLGARASVWFQTVIRGDSAPVVVGADTNLQDGTIVHEDDGLPALVGARVTVGHRAIVHGCVIEDDCLIGMGAVLLSGARIGAGSLVGAGALVREGQQIPPGSLVVGAPARVLGPVAEAHREAIARGASHYAELAASYRRRGFAAPHPLPHADRGRAPEPPMSELEWDARVAVIESTPRWCAGRLAAAPSGAAERAPAAGAWSARAVIAHLRDADREVFAPRLERLLAESEPVFLDVDLVGERGVPGAGEDQEAVVDAWSRARAALAARLATLGSSDRSRLAFHSRRGGMTLADLVASWSEHDLAHRKQLARALAAPVEGA
jgi:carbonic anhydrase/acetyltransferase-like protein (isoleucine patch superfamily)